jgi:hypothetical protein
MIALMQERPPYVRFEIGTMEYRDNSGVQHARDVEHILVTAAGTKEVHVAIAEDWIANKERLARQQPPQYPPQWAQAMRASFDLWRAGHEVPENGTSIRSWPVASPSEVKRCVEANVLTVEDLAVANEPALQRLGMGARALKDKAATWVAERDGPGRSVQELSALRIAHDEQAHEIEELRETVRKMGAAMAEKSGNGGKRRQPEPPDLRDDRDVIR